MTKKFLLLVIICVIAVVWLIWGVRQRVVAPTTPSLAPTSTAAPVQTEKPVAVIEQPAPAVAPKAVSLLESVDHAVPFTTQAPTANWDAFHEDACEEASAIMVWHYFNKTLIKSVTQVEQELADAAEWERANLGTDISIPASDAVRMLREHFNLDAKTLDDPTLTQFKTELSQNHLIIVPAAGRDLHNPNFKSPGPLYHMLVVRGYDGSGMMITNDPGTRKGEKYQYDPSVLLAATHDWNGGDVENGAKVGIVVRQ